MKQSANVKTPQATPELQSTSPVAPDSPVSTIIKKPFKINPIPKFDLSKFNLPEIPEGEWCCPWINDTPIGEEGFLLNADGTRRPTVLVEDQRLPSGWTKHLYQRSSTSGKWDVVLVGPNNKRFRSKNDVKVYLEEIGQSYNPDIYDFSIHKRRAKDIGVYVYTDGYVPPIIPKPLSDFKLDSSLDASFQDFKQEPFTGFSPNESTSSILTKITQEIKAETSTPIKTEPNTSAAVGTLEGGFTYVGALKVQIVDNLFQCPKEGCNKSVRKENHLQLHIKHYHQELSEQLGACPNMTELAYIRTMGTSIDEPTPKNQIPNSQFFEKSFQSEMRTVRKSMSPTRIKIEPKTEDQSTPLSAIPEIHSNDLKRKHSTSQVSPEIKEKRKPSATDKVNTSDLVGKGNDAKETVALDDIATTSLSSTPLKKSETIDSKSSLQKPLIPRFKIGHAAKLKGNKVPRRKGKQFKKKFKNADKEYSRKTFETGGNRVSLLHDEIQRANANFSSIPSRPSRLKFLQYSSTDSNSENSVIDPNFQQRTGSQFINENGEFIKIVRMRQEEIINCLCSYGEEDGLMIQCELCLCWQHGGCNGIEKESEVPEKYVCYICRNPERARESMKYIHDQEWLYEGKLYVANYHQPSRQYAMRSDILKQSHTLTGNLLELKRSLHSLNVKINIAKNKDHPKMYLWSKKWEQIPSKSIEPSIDTTSKIEPKPATEQIHNTSTTELKSDIATNNDQVASQKSSKTVNNALAGGEQTEKAALIDESSGEKSDTIQSIGDTLDKTTKTEAKVIASPQTPAKMFSSPKKVKPTPNIPKPEAPIDPLECQNRLLEHIQKEQNAVLSRMQTIDAQILGEFSILMNFIYKLYLFYDCNFIHFSFKLQLLNQWMNIRVQM